MNNLYNEIGMKALEPPERCCSNCAFCELLFRTSGVRCILYDGISNICNGTYRYVSFSADSIKDTDKNVCDLFCSKHNANSFAEIGTLAELEILEAAGAIENAFHPIVYKMFKNKLLTKHDATIKQDSYVRAIASYAEDRGYFKDNDFYGCPPLIMVSEPILTATGSKSETYRFDVQLSDDKMQLRHFIGLHDSWYRKKYGRNKISHETSDEIRKWAKHAGFWFDDLAESEEMYKTAYKYFNDFALE